VDQLIHAAKYQHDFRILAVLADIMQQHFEQNPPPLPEVLMPVPLHPIRQWGRGYNQSHLLAQKLAQHFNLPLDYRSCCRVKNTEQQVRLRSREARHTNVYEAFAYFPPYPAWQHVALIDDVFSTGSTLNEITRVLLASGVKRVDIWCCARR
jgi:ComF family protein